MANRKAAQLLERVFPPMLATLVSGVPPDQEHWTFEMKYDGFRAVAAIAGGELALWSRNALDLAERFPVVARALAKLRFDSAVLDGEIVVLDPTGAPRFQLLQQGGGEAVYFVFDLLWLHGVDLRGQPIETRRGLLEKLIGSIRAEGVRKTVRIAERLNEKPRKALEIAARRGYEGLIAKARGSLYASRRSKAWVKIKAVNAQELAIVGYTPSTHSSEEIGALLLGVMDGGGLVYAGKVGTGYSATLRRDLVRMLVRDRQAKPAVKDAPRVKDATWVTPRHVAQVQFTEWTSDGKLRHPSFLGLRPDKKPEECVREKPKSPEPVEDGLSSPSKARRKKSTPARASAATKRKTSSATKKTSLQAKAPDIVITHPEKLIYPRDGITKADIAAYFEAVSEPMLRALAARPLALEHWNEGIDKPSWFHQNIGRDAQAWMHLADTPTRTTSSSVKHLVADSPRALRWLAQRSALTVHMWSSREGSLDTPDWVVFDLDPARGQGIEQAIETALVLRRLFESLDLPSVPKTSGKRGIHLFLPLVPGYSHEDANAVACNVAAAVAAKLPFATVERALSKRRGRLYLDCMQNAYGKTVVAPYSLRALDGAPVSAPLRWEEVNSKLDPLKFNLRTMPERLAKFGDLFRAAVEGGTRLPKFG